MMSVHVNPGWTQLSVISSGQFKFIGELWIVFFGRASVATLSFISGYLLIKTASVKTLRGFAFERFQTLIVPMLAWNMIFIILQMSKILIIDGSGKGIFEHQSYNDILASFTGITGTTANQSLFFLRDIFVALIIVKSISAVLSKFPKIMLGIFFITAVFDLIEPLIFRPSILFFVALGAVFSIRGFVISNIFYYKKYLLFTTILLLFTYFITGTFGQDSSVASEVQNLMKRSFLIIFMLIACGALSKTKFGFWVARFESRIFETYLLHGSLFGILWVVWSSAIGNAQEISYLIFFFLAPIIAIMVGRIVGLYIDTLTSWTQKLLRGRVGSVRSNSAANVSPTISRPR